LAHRFLPVRAKGGVLLAGFGGSKSSEYGIVGKTPAGRR
jgi:hypothetical protein